MFINIAIEEDKDIIKMKEDIPTFLCFGIFLISIIINLIVGIYGMVWYYQIQNKINMYIINTIF